VSSLRGFPSRPLYRVQINLKCLQAITSNHRKLNVSRNTFRAYGSCRAKDTGRKKRFRFRRFFEDSDAVENPRRRKHWARRTNEAPKLFRNSVSHIIPANRIDRFSVWNTATRTCIDNSRLSRVVSLNRPHNDRTNNEEYRNSDTTE